MASPNPSPSPGPKQKPADTSLTEEMGKLNLSGNLGKKDRFILQSMGNKPVDALCPEKIANNLRKKGVFTARQLYKIFLRFSRDSFKFEEYLIKDGTEKIKGVTEKKAKKVTKWLLDWEKAGHKKEMQEILSELERECQAEKEAHEEDLSESSEEESGDETSPRKERKKN